MGLTKCDAAVLPTHQIRKSSSKHRCHQHSLQKDAEQSSPKFIKDVCVRAHRNFHGWWRKCSSVCLLGDMIEPMQAMAKLAMEAVDPGQSSSLRVLSLADGSMRAPSKVPSSVLLAHAFASLGISALPLGVRRVVIFGADAGNCKAKPQGKLPSLPDWIELNSLEVNNQENLASQIASQCAGPVKFDAVVMREGLCFCQDLSWESKPPGEVRLVGLPAHVAGRNCCGRFTLLPVLLNDRPAYSKGKLVLSWRPSEASSCCGCGGVWAVAYLDRLDDILAYTEDNVGNPALAHEPWCIWDRKKQDHKVHDAIACKLIGKPPWCRPPSLCQCCAGISLHAEELLSFMNNVAMVLDEATPGAFALLHGGVYAGTQPEVKELHDELEEAVLLFNTKALDPAEHTSDGSILATTLRKPKAEKAHYGEFLDGLLLSRKLQGMMAYYSSTSCNDDDCDDELGLAQATD